MITVRFQESQRYDINQDRDVVMYVAMTDKGSYWTETPLESSKSMRDKKTAFKTRVVECITAGQPPSEIDLDE